MTESPSSSTDVPVYTQRWCTLMMVPFASFANLVQTSFASQEYNNHDPRYAWFVIASLVAISSGFLLVARQQYPEITFWVVCALVIIFPFDSLIVLMALTSLLARRTSTRLTVWSIAIASVVTLAVQIRDCLRDADASLWAVWFSHPQENHAIITASTTTIVTTAVLVSCSAIVVAVLVGLHIRSKAIAQNAHEQADAALHKASQLQHNLDTQQFADVIAAEAHDTLAHSLSLLALNASALQTKALQLEKNPDAATAHAIATNAQDIRKQAAGALDEAHSIIDMLRHPEHASELLCPTQDTALTRESLESLIGDAQFAGMRINTWIDVQQLGTLDENVGKVAYRVIQEGLTNARRHAQHHSVNLQLEAQPGQGIHIHISNHADPSHNTESERSGAGLTGIRERVQSVHGVCTFGCDDHQIFHVDARIPWQTKHNS